MNLNHPVSFSDLSIVKTPFSRDRTGFAVSDRH
nr:MAG TPA_asm: hypothetical protein [Bacteriophage sp.]